MLFICILFAVVNMKTVKAYEVSGILIDIDLEGGNNDGNFKAGDNFNIKIKLKNTKNIVAASVLYKYDSNFLKVDSINISNEIKSLDIYEPYKETAKDGNKVRYAFTLMGEQEGLSGDYNFVTIKGKVNKDGIIKMEPDNTSFEVVEKKGENNMQKIDYHFENPEGDIYKVTGVSKDEDNSTSKNETTESVKNNTSKSTSNVKVELVGKNEKKSKDKSEATEKNEENENKTNTVKNPDDDKNGDNTEDEKSQEGRGDNNDSEDEASSADDEDSKQEENKPGYNKYLWIVAGAAFVIVIMLTAENIYRKNKIL